jgi:tetratricopeptide (TPR) repeat protein
MKKYFVIALLFSLVGCVSAINEKNAHRYADAGLQAQQSGDWESARIYWSRAVVNTRLAGTSEKNISITTYEYGRSAGVTCFFEEAEASLNESLEITKRINGPVHLVVLELARLNYDQSKFYKAVSYYESLPALYADLEAETKDPIGVAFVYEEYSESLANSGDKEKSDIYRKLASKLRSNGNSSNSKTERTPYGKHCSNK